MAHVYRFFGERVSQGLWSLDDDDAVHAIKVLRLSDDQVVEVMDGHGNVGVGRLKVESKSKVKVTNVTENFTPKDNFCRALLIGALKPGDVDDMIAPLVELGVDKILVWRQSDTPHFRVSDGAMERWQRLVKSAVKQSKRPWKVDVQSLPSLEAALSEVEGINLKWMLSPEATSDVLAETHKTAPGNGVAVLVGGEKGLSSAEEAFASQAGFVAVRLGPWILRAKTAAQAAAVFLGMSPRP